MSARLVLATFVAASCLVVPGGGAVAEEPGPDRSDGPGDCTVRGTAGDDRLFGTTGPDVICGRGGKDLLVGRRGADVLRGGGGTDWLHGDAGSDVMDGGRGRDQLIGEDGNDHLIGGGSFDRVAGGFGSDTIEAGGGDDDINGGGGSDVIDGEGGFNTCTTDERDLVERCTYDLEPPALTEAKVSEEVVDVTHEGAMVTVRVRVTDDTGVHSVELLPSEDWFPSGSGKLVEGGPRDGWWEADLSFQHLSRPGSFEALVVVRDRLNRETRTVAGVAVTVVDDNPDLEQPGLELLTPLPSDVYDAHVPEYRGVPVRVRVTDALSGVDSVWLTAHRQRADGSWINVSQSPGMRLVDGDEHDGVWSTSFMLDEDDRSGTWSLSFRVQDQAHSGTSQAATYVSPLRRWVWSSLPIPYERGEFTFVGRTSSDASQPEVLGATVSPTEVGTLDGAAEITLTVHAKDAGTGVSQVRVRLQHPSYVWNTFSAYLRLAAGSDLRPLGCVSGET